MIEKSISCRIKTIKIIPLQTLLLSDLLYIFADNKQNIKAMRYTEERYISLLTDFGFKRIFGTDPNKDLLIDFLNSMFDGEQVVKDVTYLNSEHVGDVHSDRKAIFDVYCENEKGEKFIVEMQNASLKAYRDMKNSLDNAEEKGVVKGERNKAIEIATKMKAKGFSVDDIVQMTGLSADEVKKIKH